MPDELSSDQNQPVSEGGHDITALLEQWGGGDGAALEQLIPIVYSELKTLASSYLRRERGEHTLQATALVHEAYLRLAGQREMQWQNRSQFFGVAAQLMRRILVDHARARLAEKRGGMRERLSLTEAISYFGQTDVDLISLDDALRDLAAIDERQSRVVELRFFGGLTIEEVAVVLGVSPATVKTDWTMAKAWLLRQISKE